MNIYTKKDAKKVWTLMINRCSQGYAEVCDEWKNYKSFEDWYMNNTYGTKQFRLELDKDLLSKGPKIYSPDTCCLLPKSLNLLLSSCVSRNRLLPGVQYNSKSKTFTATVNRSTITKKKTFKSERDAFEFYKLEKEKNIKIAAEAYSFLLPFNIYKALIEYEVEPVRGEWKDGFQRNFETYKQ